MLTRDFAGLWKRSELFRCPEVSDGSAYFGTGFPGVRPLLLHGTSVNGRGYAAAAYYGVPEGRPPFPAVILFHGGGGTAFPHYVREWNRRGYAALIFDHYGKLPVCDLTQEKRPRVPGSWLEAEGIPDLNADTTTSPPEALELWIGNAISLTIAANSLLRSLPEIMPDHIGVVGLSWGAVMGGTVAAFDGRLDFAALIYGCGFSRMAESELLFSRFGDAPWEPEHFLGAAEIPLCWVGGADDPFFSPRSWSASVFAAPGSSAATLIPELGHSHDGFRHPLLFRFADMRRGIGAALPRLGVATLEDGVVSAPILSQEDGEMRAELVFTCDRRVSPARKFRRVPADISGNRVYAELPRSCSGCFLNIGMVNRDNPIQDPGSSSWLETL